MKRMSVLSTLAVLSLTVFASLPAQAETNILANAATPRFKPTITFSGSYSEKIVTRRYAGEEGVFYERDLVSNPEKLTAKVVANITGFDVAEIVPGMPVLIKIGGFEFSSEIDTTVPEESDPADLNIRVLNVPKKYALFRLRQQYEVVRGEDVFYAYRQVGTVKFSWTTKLLTVDVNIVNLGGTGLYPVIDHPEGQSVYNDPAMRKVYKVIVPVEVRFGTAAGQRNAYLNSSASAPWRRYGSEEGGDYAEFYPVSLSYGGTADTANPVVTVGRITLAGDMASFGGKIVDGYHWNDGDPDSGSMAVAIFLKGAAEPAECTIEVGETDARGASLYSVAELRLGAGRNTFYVVVRDPDGNVTTVARTVTVK